MCQGDNVGQGMDRCCIKTCDKAVTKENPQISVGLFADFSIFSPLPKMIDDDQRPTVRSVLTCMCFSRCHSSCGLCKVSLGKWMASSSHHIPTTTPPKWKKDTFENNIFSNQIHRLLWPPCWLRTAYAADQHQTLTAQNARPQTPPYHQLMYWS